MDCTGEVINFVDFPIDAMYGGKMLFYILSEN
jgi:hypothetical protein